MNLIRGIKYNLRGLWVGIKTPKLLFLGFVRFALVIFITVVSSGLILAYHQEIFGLIWTKPESSWIIWLWHVVSWLLSMMLVGLAAVLSYLVSQILFSVLIMDYMSRITERMMTGQVNEPEHLSLLRLFSYLIKQEIPRTIIPVLLALLLLFLGFLTPLGPLTALLTSCMAVIFLSWDNTDLLPARRMLPFKERFRLMSRTILFHLGFGLLFLVPGLNILFLSFAPVGATLYYIEEYDDKDK